MRRSSNWPEVWGPPLYDYQMEERADVERDFLTKRPVLRLKERRAMLKPTLKKLIEWL